MIDLKVSMKALNQFIEAVDRLENTVKQEAKSLPKWHGQDYYGNLIKNITTDRYGNVFSSLNPKYRAWKIRVSKSNSYWKLFGDLQNSISLTQKNGGYSVGIASGAMTKSRLLPSMYGNGKTITRIKSIEMIARTLEDGHKKIPARPLWRLTREEYWKSDYVRRVKISRSRMKRSWR